MLKKVLQVPIQYTFSSETQTNRKEQHVKTVHQKRQANDIVAFKLGLWLEKNTLSAAPSRIAARCTTALFQKCQLRDTHKTAEQKIAGRMP